MVFEDEAHTKCVRVLALRTVKDVGLLTSQPSTTVSNFHHMLIRPKGAASRPFACCERRALIRAACDASLAKRSRPLPTASVTLPTDSSTPFNECSTSDSVPFAKPSRTSVGDVIRPRAGI